jgi:stalled ribosome rescue protein Dom34
MNKIKKVANCEMRRRYKRGYFVAVLIGFEEKRAVLWQIFSKIVKHHVTVEMDINDKKNLYNFRESVMDKLRPLLREGVRSIIITAPMKTNYAKDFLVHVQKHHQWLFQEDSSNNATFGELVGSAVQLHEVSELIKTKEFRSLLSETTSEDADHIIDTLEKRLNETDGSSVILYSIKDIEELVYNQLEHSKLKPEYIILTNKYLADTKEKNRVHRLLQISKNKNIKTRIVKVETKAGVRLSQFGGLVCFTKTKQ